MLTVSDLLAPDVSLSVPEAVAVTAAATDALDQAGDDAQIPRLALIELCSHGSVRVSPIVTGDGERSRVVGLAELLHKLLQLDGPAARSAHRIPGRLMLLLARTRGEIDLPAPSYDEFRQALRLYAAGVDLAALYKRATSARVSAATFPPVCSHATRINDIAPAPDSRVAARRQAAWLLAAAAAALLTGSVAGGVYWMRSSPSQPLDRPAVVRTAAPADTAMRETTSAPPRSAVGVVRSPGWSTEAALITTARAGGEAFSPSFSRDGRHLVFHVGHTPASLVRASLDEQGAVVSVTPILADGADNYHPAMSPDGRSIAFDSNREGVRAVYVAASDGTAIERVSGGGYAAVPRWSPDGRLLAFIKAEPNAPRVWHLWIQDLASGQARQVTHHRVGQVWSASWFPDGERVAYTVEDQLVIANLRRGTQHAFRSPVARRLVRTPAVSPNGRAIVFQVFRDGVWMLDVPSARMHRIADDRTAEEFVWEPDGRAIAFHARHDGVWSLWKADVSTAADSYGREGQPGQ